MFTTIIFPIPFIEICFSTESQPIFTIENEMEEHMTKHAIGVASFEKK